MCDLKMDQSESNSDPKMKPKEDPKDEYVMYILVNRDLKMGQGKVASQCCHSACKVVQYHESQYKGLMHSYLEWTYGLYAKIVLKSDEKTMKECIEKYSDTTKEIWCIGTYDAGRTQIPSGSLTTVAFTPILKSRAPDFIKALKLL